MFKNSIAIGCAVAASLMMSIPAQAADPETRILRIPVGLCADFRQDLIRWAARTRGHAAYAVPVLPRGVSYTCDDQGPQVPAAYSFNYDEQTPADKRSRADCNVTRPDGFRKCVVIGRAFPISKR